MNRRSFLLMTGGLLSLPATSIARQAETGAPLPARRPGELDIHHIDTGRGNSTLIIGPDGTSLLIDAGASPGFSDLVAPARPDDSLRPGQWIARYARNHAPAIDILVATHIHPDHVGDVTASSPLAPGGDYRLTGISEVAAEMPVKRVIDRGFPGYGDRPPPQADFALNYLAYLKWRRGQGQPVEPFAVGSDTQMALNAPQAFPTFKIRNLAASGRIWTGQGDDTRDLFAARPKDAAVDENLCSAALRLSYGAFSYFAGGDLTCDTFDGQAPWRDVETPVVELAGRTEVAAVDHHGYFDACGPAFVRALNAQVYVVQAWHATHPGQAQLQRLLGAWADKTQADVFLTENLAANHALNARFLSKVRSLQGHVVIRVEPGGDRYQVFVLDSTQRATPVAAVFGPYTSRV